MLKIADLWSDGFGGSSGPLWGSFIAAAAGKLPEKLDKASRYEWIDGYVAGVEAMKQVGGAKPGMRTMVDALHEGMIFLTQCNGIPSVGKLAKFIRTGAE